MPLPRIARGWQSGLLREMRLRARAAAYSPANPRTPLAPANAELGAGDGDRTRDIKLGNYEPETLNPLSALTCAPSTIPVIGQNPGVLMAN